MLTPTGYSNAASNIVADVLIILLPLPLIKSLNLPLHQRVVLGAVFCLGILCVAANASHRPKC